MGLFLGEGSDNRRVDLTATKYGTTESEATIGANTASAVSPTQAHATPAWPNEPKESHLANAGLSQQSCGMNRFLVGNTSTKCQDVNFATPPTSPESQPYPVAADGKQLRPEPVSQQGNMMVDAVSYYDVCHSSQGHRDSLSIGAHSPRTACPVEVVQASLQENEIPAGESCHDAIPEVRTPFPAKSSDESYQGQVLDDTSSASTHVESEATEAGSGSDAEMSSTAPSLRLLRHKSSQMHETMQSKDGDAGSEDSGDEDGLDGLVSHHREENSSSLPDVEDPGSEDDDLDDVHQGRKRRKVSKSLSCAVRSTATSSRSPRQIRSATHATQLPSGIRTSKRDSHSPIPSPATPALSCADMFLARFEEWPLRDVLLKRITEGGKTTFQLQFEWDPVSCQPHAGRSVSHLKKRKRLRGTLRSASKSSSGRWPPEGNNISSTPDTIHVAEDGVGDGSSDDNLSTSSNFEDNSDSDREPRHQTFQRKKTQRRRWTTKDEVLLRQLKHDMLSDCEIATRLRRTESGVKQHWDIMEKARRCREKTKDV